MLEHEDLERLVNKKDLSLSDLDLLNEHVTYIVDIQSNDEELPSDVFNALSFDLNVIIGRLQTERKNLIKRHTKVVNGGK